MVSKPTLGEEEWIGSLGHDLVPALQKNKMQFLHGNHDISQHACFVMMR